MILIVGSKVFCYEIIRLVTTSNNQYKMKPVWLWKKNCFSYFN